MALVVALSGCANLLGGGSKATFDLTAARDFGSAGAQRGLLVVAEPVALAILDSESIIVRSGGSFSAAADGRWSDRLPKLLQNRIVQSFENANRLKAVGRPGERLAADYSLVTDVRAFYLDATANEAVAELSAKIVAERTGRVVAGQVIRATVPTSAGGAPAIAAALDQALGKVLVQLVTWTAGRI
jgi:cholesterol transport system auxiliary component